MHFDAIYTTQVMCSETQYWYLLIWCASSNHFNYDPIIDNTTCYQTIWMYPNHCPVQSNKKLKRQKPSSVYDTIKTWYWIMASPYCLGSVRKTIPIANNLLLMQQEVVIVSPSHPPPEKFWKGQTNFVCFAVFTHPFHPSHSFS